VSRGEDYAGLEKPRNNGVRYQVDRIICYTQGREPPGKTGGFTFGIPRSSH
jgi:hypothetical protein